MESKYLVWEMIKIAREHRKLVEKGISSLGIHPSQHHFLMYLSRNGPSTQNSIAEGIFQRGCLFCDQAPSGFQ